MKWILYIIKQILMISFILLCTALFIIDHNSKSIITSSSKKSAIKHVKYTGPIYNIFFHSLIAYPRKAFDNDRTQKQMDDWFITVKECKEILKRLYESNYILVDVADLYTRKTVKGKTIYAKKQLHLPANKKPLILSIDDVNYYPYTIKNGTVSKLITDKNFNISTLTLTKQGKRIISRDYEIIPLLEKFIQQYPDFALNNAKGIIALTGMHGILGYATHKQNADLKSNQHKVNRLVHILKRNGWKFASHSYWHIHMQTCSDSLFMRDFHRWNKEVKPLIGKTNLLIYPYGEAVARHGARYNFLVKNGFSILFSVNHTSTSTFAGNSIRFGRIPVDGKFLRGHYGKDSKLIDIEGILDPARDNPFIENIDSPDENLLGLKSTFIDSSQTN